MGCLIFECSGSTYSKDETFFGSRFEQPGKFFKMQQVTQLASAFAPPFFWVRTCICLVGSNIGDEDERSENALGPMISMETFMI